MATRQRPEQTSIRRTFPSNNHNRLWRCYLQIFAKSLSSRAWRAIQEKGATMSSGQREQGRVRLGDDYMLASFG
jgi:hypothetical protein